MSGKHLKENDIRTILCGPAVGSAQNRKQKRGIMRMVKKAGTEFLGFEKSISLTLAIIKTPT